MKFNNSFWRKGLILIVSSTILLYSCFQDSTRMLLDDIETYIQEHPDSALTVLRNIDTLELKTNSSKAKYSLLYSIALDKNYIDTTNLAIIHPAIEYYSKHGTSTQKMKAFFYQGCIYANRGEDDRAMYNYLLALEDSSKVTNNYYKELINSAISTIFSKNHNEEQELQYALDAFTYGNMAGDSVGVWYITGHIASCYGNMQRYEDAENAYQAFFAMPVYDSLSFIRRRISYAKDLIRKPNPEPRKSIEILNSIATNNPETMTTEAYCIYAYALQFIGEESAANDILRQLESLNDNQAILKLWRYRILREQGHYKEAIADLEQSVLVQDSIVLSSLNQSLLRSQRDYLRAKTDMLKIENGMAKQRVYLILIVSLVIFVMLVLLYLNRRASFNKRIDELSSLHLESQRMLDLQNAKTTQISAQLAEKDAALFDLRRQYASMYKAQYKTLNDLCAAYLSPIKKDRKEVLYDEAMRQLDIIINDKDSQDRFMSLVNNSLDNIMDKLRTDLPNHKELDFHFLMYIIVGFDATTISNLTGYSVGTVYTKKNRLKGTISSLSSPYKDFYLQFIQ